MSTNKNLSRRRFLQTSALLTAGGVLAACAAPAAPSTGGEAAAPAGELIELTYMTPDRELGTNVKNIEIEGFNKLMEETSQPYRVVGVLAPATDNDIKTKLTLDAAAGTLSDIFSPLGETLADFVAAGYIADLRPYIESWDGWAQYPEVLRGFSFFGDKLVGLPGGSTFSFFYRKDLLEGAGIPITQPNTWEEFFASCGQIAEKTDAIPAGIPAATPWGGGTWGEAFKQIWLSFNGSIYEDGKWVVHSENLLKAFQVYETLATNGWLTVDELLSPNPWEPIKYDGFPNGTVGIVTGGDWQWTFDWGPEGATPIEGLFEKVDRWGFPAEDGKPFTYVDGNAGPVVAATAKSIEGATEFIKYIAEPSVMCETIKVYLGGAVARVDFAEQCPEYVDMVNGKMAQASQFFETGRTFNFNQIGSGKIADGVARATEDIITGTQTAEEAMEAFAAAMTDSLGAEMVTRAS